MPEQQSPGALSNASSGTPEILCNAAGPDGPNAQMDPAAQLMKLQRFFTTLKQFANDHSETIEQIDANKNVTDMIADLLVGKYDAESFVNELRALTQFPLRPYVVPFLKETMVYIKARPDDPLVKSVLGSFGKTNKIVSAPSRRTPVIMQSSNALDSRDDGGSPSGNEASLGHDGRKRKASRLESIFANKPSKRQAIEDPKPTAVPQSTSTDHRPIGSSYAAPNSCCVITTAASQYQTTATPVAPQPPVSSTFSMANLIQGSTHSPLQPMHSFPILAPPIHQLPVAPMQPLAAAPPSIAVIRPPVNGVQQTTMKLDDIQQQWIQADKSFLAFAANMEQLRRSMYHYQQAYSVINGYNQKSKELEDLKRRQEEAIQIIKRQAVDELRKATSAADQKANEKIVADRRQYEARLLEAYSLFNVQEDRPENCKNCGRRAANVCSGCQRVQYCGAFCQHRDWQRHRMYCKQPDPQPLPVQAATAVAVEISKANKPKVVPLPSKRLEPLERPNPTKSA